MIDQNYLNECFDYNRDTGDLTWKIRPRKHFKTDMIFRSRNTRFAGKKAGSIFKGGYKRIRIDNTDWLAHRVIWFIVYGYIPNIVDHIDNNPSNNRICNLRDVSQMENMKNMLPRKYNTSGVTGVIWDKEKRKWEARHRVDRKHKHVGYFDNIESARLAVIESRVSCGFTHNHGQFKDERFQ
jgi:hypothetical protein